MDFYYDEKNLGDFKKLIIILYITLKHLHNLLDSNPL